MRNTVKIIILIWSCKRIGDVA